MFSEITGIKTREMIGSLLEEIVKKLALEILKRQLDEETTPDCLEDCGVCQVLVRNVLGSGGGNYSVQFTLHQPIIGIGAPVHHFLPRAASLLGAEVVLPEHANVANAIGAVVGSIMQTVRVLITPQDGGEVFRVHCEDGVHDFAGLEEAAAFALQAAENRAAELARRAGAIAVTVSVERRDQSALAAGDELFVQSLVTATATGRPHLAHDQQAG